ncbi:SDR family oxidoreductase [Flavobacterium sp. GT3R68]|uniref:SDR family oxidoreductase n=1 Tax=Flavobacterium sp. GT3R68 TaxID=2594437 RepID=UPI000F85C969|nr:SDR family oxidoreductase [Flavobacterium sp. GT3R68]RTY96007.1 SDR family oxidoreductase [Flavobacterium sp. GSN2]TRW93780.1 SDR family oxidoreductase [Flavobacterium sp. GT3R68]
MKQISILGCGWLGFPLAEHLIAEGHLVKGSTTSSEKLEVLEKSGMEPFLIALTENGIQGTITDFLYETEVLIIDIPPKLRGPDKENFVAKIQLLIAYIEKSSVEKVLFVSSTSIYADDNSVITENTNAQPDTESGKQLLQAEQFLQSSTHFKTTVLRFGGLIGDNRHPIHFLAGRQNLENPDGPINLIHQSDCIGIISKIIKKETWGDVFNAVAPFHPSRKEYYSQKATQLNLVTPEFNHQLPSKGKVILSDRVEKVLDYQFTITQP